MHEIKKEEAKFTILVHLSMHITVFVQNFKLRVIRDALVSFFTQINMFHYVAAERNGSY